MQKEKPRLARLTAILTQLQSKRLLTATELSRKHGVSVRTIYRDIRTLEQSGIPIVAEEGRGYTILEGYKLPPVMFTEAEANALVTAEQLIQHNSDQSFVEQYQSAIQKIKATLKHQQQSKTELLSERLQIRTSENLYTSHYLMRLQSAITNYEVIQLDYLSLEEVSSQRQVEPFALYNTQNRWILLAFCQMREAFRAFRLDRIQELKTTDLCFEPHTISLEDYFEACRKAFRVLNKNHAKPLTYP